MVDWTQEPRVHVIRRSGAGERERERVFVQIVAIDGTNIEFFDE